MNRLPADKPHSDRLKLITTSSFIKMAIKMRMSFHKPLEYSFHCYTSIFCRIFSHRQNYLSFLNRHPISGNLYTLDFSGSTLQTLNCTNFSIHQGSEKLSLKVNLYLH